MCKVTKLTSDAKLVIRVLEKLKKHVDYAFLREVTYHIPMFMWCMSVVNLLSRTNREDTVSIGNHLKPFVIFGVLVYMRKKRQRGE